MKRCFSNCVLWSSSALSYTNTYLWGCSLAKKMKIETITHHVISARHSPRVSPIPRPQLLNLLKILHLLSQSWNSHNMKVTVFKWTIQWHWVHSQCCVNTTSFKFQNIFLTSKGKPTPICSPPPDLHPTPQPLDMLLLLTWINLLLRKLGILLYQAVRRNNPGNVYKSPSTTHIRYLVKVGSFLRFAFGLVILVS